MTILSKLRIGAGGVLFVLLALGCAPLRAQSPGPDYARTWALDSVLVRFDREFRTGAAQGMGSRVVYDIFYLPAPYHARRDSLLNRLEHLAMSSDHSGVRSAAASRIAFAGQPNQENLPVPGVMQRLVRLYQATTDVGVLLLIRRQLPEQAERGAAVALLRSIAASADPHLYRRMDDIGDERQEALHLLSLMGEEGKAALQALHRGEIRSPRARAALDRMARGGFQVRDIARERANERTRAQASPKP